VVTPNEGGELLEHQQPLILLLFDGFQQAPPLMRLCVHYVSPQLGALLYQLLARAIIPHALAPASSTVCAGDIAGVDIFPEEGEEFEEPPLAGDIMRGSASKQDVANLACLLPRLQAHERSGDVGANEARSQGLTIIVLHISPVHFENDVSPRELLRNHGWAADQ
jgi:hypothetical protein